MTTKKREKKECRHEKNWRTQELPGFMCIVVSLSCFCIRFLTIVNLIFQNAKFKWIMILTMMAETTITATVAVAASNTVFGFNVDVRRLNQSYSIIFYRLTITVPSNTYTYIDTWTRAEKARQFPSSFPTSLFLFVVVIVIAVDDDIDGYYSNYRNS